MESLTHLNIVSKGQSQSNFSQRTPTAASYPDVSLLMKMCAQRKAGRRQPFPWSLAVHHQSLAFRARLCHAKNEAPEEEAAPTVSPCTSSFFFTLLLSNSENREHLKNFRNVDCVLANFNKVQDTQANLKTTN